MRKYWSDEEREQLKVLFPETSNAELAVHFKCSYDAVSGQSYRMKLKKSDAFLSAMGDRLRASGKSNMFPKGHIPANKGKKVSPEVYAIMAKSMFKKGAEPHNTTYDGHERTDINGYVMVRVQKGKFVHKHRLLWEQHNGAIPEGMLLVFKDGNKQHISLDNLELISKNENMARNTIHRFPAELKENIHLLTKLKRKINKLDHGTK
jgi:hypothetical protein